jgi:hypothetical protein
MTVLQIFEEVGCLGIPLKPDPRGKSGEVDTARGEIRRDETKGVK